MQVRREKAERLADEELMPLVGGKGATGQVMELDRHKKPRWSIELTTLPVDAQVVGPNRVLVCEYQGMRVPGEVVDITEVQSSEQPARNFYRRWAQFMEAKDWGDLATWRRNNRQAAE